MGDQDNKKQGFNVRAKIRQISDDGGEKTFWTRFMEFMLNASLKIFTVFNKITGYSTKAMMLVYIGVGLFVSMAYGVLAHNWVWIAFVFPLHILMFTSGYKFYHWKIGIYVRETEGTVSFHLFPQALIKESWYGILFSIVFTAALMPLLFQGPQLAAVFFFMYFVISSFVQVQSFWYSKGWNPSMWSRAKSKAKAMWNNRVRIPKLAPVGV